MARDSDFIAMASSLAASGFGSADNLESMDHQFKARMYMPAMRAGEKVRSPFRYRSMKRCFWMMGKLG
jgi:hypothetical protein